MIYPVFKYSPTFVTCLMALKDLTADPTAGKNLPPIATDCREKGNPIWLRDSE